ncbi:MAG: hypothetical protein HY736_25790 [Verrucomicrobia bacterium]|nr:hypothetical protein [Verrucomicrobiota bacterium]
MMKYLILFPALLLSALAQPLDLASRRELFLDRHLVERMEGTELRLHVPLDRGTAFLFDRPHEGAFCGYVSIVTLPAGGFRAYYRGLAKAGPDGSTNEVCAFAESTDGIRWTKPAENIVLRNAAPVTHNFSVFIDPRPGVPADERWKGTGGTIKTGLIRFVSADGIAWRKFMGDAPMLPPAREYRYDSQNLAFWSESEERYVCYFRSFKDVPGKGGVRWISRASSPDFRVWSFDGEMSFRSADGGVAPPEHLYTNQTSPYMRAPHLYVSIAARFQPKRRVLTAEEARAIQVDAAYYNDISDSIVMTTRGGTVYDRTFLESFVRPGLGLENWTSRTNYPALNVIQTGPAEMSFFVQKGYGQPGHHLARYSLRLDGFASLHAGYAGGEMRSKPFRFAGSELEINYATSAAGSIRFELQDETGRALPGYSLNDAREIIGDQIERIVSWAGGTNVAALAGKTLRLRVAMKDADLYSLRFR